MDIANIIQLLQNSGFNVKGADSSMTYLLIEDPSCILRNLETFIHYGWIVISLITAILIFGWAISKIRGAKTDVVTNFRNLIIICGVLSAMGPIVNMVFGDDLVARHCKIMQVPITELNEILERRNAKLSADTQLHENIEIVDYGYEYSDMDMPPIDVPDIDLQPDPDHPGEYVIAPVTDTENAQSVPAADPNTPVAQ